MTSIREAEAYLESGGRDPVSAIRMAELYLPELDHPERAFRVIHVAGTNGKGSVCSFLEAVLLRAGFRTGTFLSPHLERINERFRIDGRNVDDARLLRVLSLVREAEEAGKKKGLPPLFFFARTFLAACLLFREAGVETAVLETGLGGRLDATNAVAAPDLTVITSISRDHMKLLGETIPEIAGEKAAIIKAGVPVVFDAADAEAATVIAREAERRGSPLYPLSPADYRITGTGAREIDFCTSFRYDGNNVFRIRSVAPYETQNAALAVLAVRTLAAHCPDVYGGISRGDVVRGLLHMRFPGRMEQIGENIYLDGAHNEDGIRRFLEAAEKVRAGRPASLVYSAAADKDSGRMIRLLAEGLPWKKIYVTEIPGARSRSCRDFAGLFREAGRGDAEPVPDCLTCCARAADEADGGLLFICGSLYSAGAVRAFLRGRKKRGDQA